MAQISKSFYSLIIFVSLILVVTGKGKWFCILFFMLYTTFHYLLMKLIYWYFTLQI